MSLSLAVDDALSIPFLPFSLFSLSRFPHLDLDHARVGGVLAGLLIVVEDLGRGGELGAVAAAHGF